MTPPPYTQSARNAILAGIVAQMAESCAEAADVYERQLERVIEFGRQPIDWQPKVIGGRGS